LLSCLPKAVSFKSENHPFMQELINSTQLITDSLSSFGQQFMGALPRIIAALAILLIGWIIARVLRGVVAKVLDLAKFDELADKIEATAMLEKGNITAKPSSIVSRFAYWIVMLLVFITATNSLGWTVVSEKLGDLIDYLPKLFTAGIIFAIGIWIATFIRGIISAATSSMGVSTGNIISSFIFYFLATMITLTSLQQAGINTDIITSNIFIILGAVLVAGGIAYGFAARELLTNILSGYFSRSKYEIGQRIRINDVEGEITHLDNISVTVQTANDMVVVPIKKLVENDVHILS